MVILIERIISGGQTGADRAGLDVAIAAGLSCGGWCPKGRKAEDGRIPDKYPLQETESSEYPERTKRNVKDSDGTMVFTFGEAIGGSALTIKLAKKYRKPVLHIDLSDGSETRDEKVSAWVRQNNICILNVAGSRESKSSGIYKVVRDLLISLLTQKNRTFIADPRIIRFHEEVQEYAYLVNKRIFEIHEDNDPNLLAGGALHSICADIFSIHRAILCLCRSGWALVVPILLRAMWELFLSAIVIVKGKEDAEYMGFRYTYWFLKAEMNAPESSEEYRKEVRKEINTGLQRLDRKLREKAKNFMFQEKMRAYWYSPEFSGPTDMMEKCAAAKGWKEIYKLFSSATHGGLLGLRIMKDDPDEVHPNPRGDKRSQNMALGTSSRIMLEVSNVRGIFEKVNIVQEYKRLLSKFLDLGEVIETSVPHRERGSEYRGSEF